MLDFRRSKGSTKTIPVFKLSAKMVDLSLQHNRRVSVLPDIPTHLPAKSEVYRQEPKAQLISARIPNYAEVNKAAQPNRKTEVYSALLRAGRELLRKSISRISDHRIRIRPLPLWTATGIVALALLVFGAVYGLRGYKHDSVKKQSQIAPAPQPREKVLLPATGIASANTHNDAHTVATSKSKPHRRQSDYVAKNTYVYYGKGGKPSH